VHVFERLDARRGEMSGDELEAKCHEGRESVRDLVTGLGARRSSC
jgi:hypothetical protein